MNKKVLTALIIIIALNMCFSSCSVGHYIAAIYPEEKVEQLFYDKRSLYDNMSAVIINDDDFWPKARDHEFEEYANIMTPDNKEKMELFSSKDRQIIKKFFNHTKPFCISYFYQKCISITYITKEHDGYILVYYFDKTSRDEWISTTAKDCKVFKQLDDDWFLYY